MLPREELLRAQRRFRDIFPRPPEAVCRGRSVSCEIDAGYSRSIRCPEYGTHIVSTADIMQKHCDLHTIYNIRYTVPMLSLFPQLLFLAPFSTTILRISAGVVILLVAWIHMS